MYLKLTAGQGIEPQFSPSKGDVLPLDEPAMYHLLKYCTTPSIHPAIFRFRSTLLLTQIRKRP